MNIYEKIVDLIILILILFVFPVVYVNKKSNLFTYQAVSRETHAFLEDIQTHGIVSRQRYESFCNTIYAYKEPLKIELLYETEVIEPAYTIDEISHKPRFSGDIYRYDRVVETREMIEYMEREHQDYPLAAGGYFEIHILFTGKDYEAVYCGGTVRSEMNP